MAEKHNMGRMLLSILLIVNTSSVLSKLCLNEECSEPITNARIKIPYKTKDVHLYVGDEVDILSKSDDGSHMEFEIGEVKGIIPTDHLKESSLKIDQDSLIHLPEFLGEDDENYHNPYMDGDDTDDSEGEIEEPPDDFMDEDAVKIQNQKKASHKVKKPGKTNDPPKKSSISEKNANGVTDKGDVREKEKQAQSKADKIGDKEQQMAVSDDASVAEGVREALAPGSKGNGKIEQVDFKPGSFVDGQKNQDGDTEQISSEPENPTGEPMLLSHSEADFNLAMRKLENYKIMKERYIQDYLDTNHRGQNVDEKVLKQVEDFVEGDMMEQLKEPDSDLMHMLLHYDPKDLPGKRDGEDNEDAVVGKEKGSDAMSKEEDKPHVNLEQSTEKSMIVSNDTELNGTSSMDEHQLERSVTDNDHTNSNVSKMSETESLTPTSPERLSEDTSAETSEKSSVEQSTLGGHIEHSDHKDAASEEKKQDFAQHPNYPALKKKYVESYLSKQYKGEEVSSQMRLMVENLVDADLLQQLQIDESVREELYRLVPSTDHQGTVELETNIKEEGRASTPGLEATLVASEVTLSSSVQHDSIQITTSFDNVVHSTVVKSIIAQEFLESQLQGEESKNHSQQPTDEGESAEKKSETGAGPIPPAGGKDSQRHISDGDYEKEQVGEEGGNHFSSEIADNELNGAKEYTAKEKENESMQNAPRNGNADDLREENADLTDEGVERTAEEKSANNEESTSNFSFKRLGSVLKDRFKAFAKKIIADEEEEKASQDGKESRSSDNSDTAENSDKIPNGSYQELNATKIESIADSEDEEHELGDVPQASVLEEDTVTEDKIVPETTNEQDASGKTPSDRNEKVITKNNLFAGVELDNKNVEGDEIAKNNGFSAEVVHGEKTTEEREIFKDGGMSGGAEHGEQKTDGNKIVRGDGLSAAAVHDENKTEREEIVKDGDKAASSVHDEKKIEGEKIAKDGESLASSAHDEKMTGRKETVKDGSRAAVAALDGKTTEGEEIARDDSLSAGTQHEEMTTEDPGIININENGEEVQKSIDVAKNSIGEDESHAIDQRHNLVSLTTVVPASGSHESSDGTSAVEEKNNLDIPPNGTERPTGDEGPGLDSDGVKGSVGTEAPEDIHTNNSSGSQEAKGTDAVGNSLENLKNVEGHIDSSQQFDEKSNGIKTADGPYKTEERSSDLDSSGSGPNEADANINVLDEKVTHVESLVNSYSRRQVAPDDNKYSSDALMKMKISEEDSRDMLLEMCNNQPSLPECDQLRGAKIYRGESQRTDTLEESTSDGDIGRLERAWRNMMKIMKRIKLMKLGFVQLFHGPLSVMGLEDISHWIHEQIEHASPEVITITTCCLLLIFALVMRSCFSTKHVRVGASAYDVHKMRQSRQKILQENTEDMASELKRLQELIQSKDSELNKGDQSYNDLQSKLESLQNKFNEQESLSNEAHSQCSSSAMNIQRGSSKRHQSPQSSKSSATIKQRSSKSLLETIRRELQDGKLQQKRLHEMMEEKEQEIQQADDMALRHQNEIERQNEISETLNDRLEKVVNELDLKDGIVLDLQEKNGALRIELENMEMERRQMEKEKNEIAERCKELEEKFNVKEEENSKLQDEMDEKENEIEVLRDCMAQINNGKLDGEAVEDFDTPEEDPDIKEQLKTERLKQIVESTQAMANLKKCEKEKEYFQEGYLEELEKRENAETHVKNLKEEVERLSKDVNTYKNSSTEYHIKLETLQHYFKQQETELHRKLSVEEQSRLDFQKKYQEIMGQSSSAIEETSSVKSQNEDLKNEIKEMERSIKEVKIAAEKETHELWIKNRQINRDLEEMKRERDIYRKRLLEAETAKKASAAPQGASIEKSRDSPGGSDDGRPASPGSQKSAASGVPSFMIRPRAMFPPPPPPPIFPPMHMPVGAMPPQLPPFGQMPPMMGRPQGNMPGPPSGVVRAPMSSSGQPLGPVTGAPTGPAGFPQPSQSVPSSQLNTVSPPSNFGAPTTSGFQSNPTMPPNYMDALSSNQNIGVQQPSSASPQTKGPITRRDSQKSLTNGGGRQGQGQTTPVMQRRFQPQPSSTMQGPFQSTPVNSPNMSQASQLPPSHPSLVRAQTGQSGRPNLQNRTMSNDIA